LRLGDHLNREEVQLWSNSLNFSAGVVKKCLMRFTLITLFF